MVTALNHPPTVEDLVFEPSKFVSTCNGVEIAADLKALYGAGNVTTKDPCTILRPEDVDGFDVVWFSNPGWPMGNSTSMPTTFNTLLNFRGTGGGLVLQGDDNHLRPPWPVFQGGPIGFARRVAARAMSRCDGAIERDCRRE